MGCRSSAHSWASTTRKEGSNSVFYWLKWSAYRHEVFPARDNEGNTPHNCFCLCIPSEHGATPTTHPWAPPFTGSLQLSQGRTLMHVLPFLRRCTGEAVVWLFLSILRFLRIRKTSCFYLRFNFKKEKKNLSVAKSAPCCLPSLSS